MYFSIFCPCSVGCLLIDLWKCFMYPIYEFFVACGENILPTPELRLVLTVPSAAH